MSLFSKYVSLKKGAYLIIEHTEALHVVDVNSGNRAKVDNDQEQTAMDVNLAAAAEIARQLRLRDMGGIIVIDFIDLHKSENRTALVEKMREMMASRRPRCSIRKSKNRSPTTRKRKNSTTSSSESTRS